MKHLLQQQSGFRWRCLGIVLVMLVPFLLAGCLMPNEPPVARFTSERIGEVLTFRFDAAASYDPDGFIQAYRWDLGDGSVKFGQVIIHTYPDDIKEVTTYRIPLTVTDNKGKTASATQEISIDPRAIFVVKVRNAMDYWTTVTRNFALTCIRPENSGSYNIGQICDIWDTCFEHWTYVNDPPGGVFEPTPASETISAGLRGDCDDFAVLLAASIMAIGGGTRFIAAYTQTSGHAYAEVYAGLWGTSSLQSLTDYICLRYGITKVWYWVDDNGDAWLNLDWWEYHPGGRYYEGTRAHIIYPWTDGRFHPVSVWTGLDSLEFGGRVVSLSYSGAD